MNTEVAGVEQCADVASAEDRVVTEGRPSLGHRVAARWRTVAIAAVLVISACTCTALYYETHRHDRADADVTRTVIDAASTGSTALLSYAPPTLDQDLATARSHLTGDFLDYYSGFADQFVAPAARQRDIKATARVVRAAAVDVKADTAEVLLFVNQETTSRDTAVPAQAASSVKVGMRNVDGTWLISSFDPL